MLILIFSLFGVVFGCNVRPMDFECDDGWTPVQRKLSGWCVKIIRDTEVAEKCFVLNGRYSGVESYDELNTLMAMLNESGQQHVRIAARLKDECNCNVEKKCENTEDCQIPNVWQWVDTTVTGNQMFNAVKPQFSSENMYGSEIYISMENNIGLIDGDGSEFKKQNIICGKKPN